MIPISIFIFLSTLIAIGSTNIHYQYQNHPSHISHINYNRVHRMINPSNNVRIIRGNPESDVHNQAESTNHEIMEPKKTDAGRGVKVMKLALDSRRTFDQDNHHHAQMSESQMNVDLMEGLHQIMKLGLDSTKTFDQKIHQPIIITKAIPESQMNLDHMEGQHDQLEGKNMEDQHGVIKLGIVSKRTFDQNIHHSMIIPQEMSKSQMNDHMEGQHMEDQHEEDEHEEEEEGKEEKEDDEEDDDDDDDDEDDDESSEEDSEEDSSSSSSSSSESEESEEEEKKGSRKQKYFSSSSSLREHEEKYFSSLYNEYENHPYGGITILRMFTASQYRNNVCSIMPRNTQCTGSGPTYFYNKFKGHCECYNSGSCGMNENVFNSLYKCTKTCGVHPINQPKLGKCNSKHERESHTFNFSEVLRNIIRTPHRRVLSKYDGSDIFIESVEPQILRTYNDANSNRIVNKNHHYTVY